MSSHHPNRVTEAARRPQLLQARRVLRPRSRSCPLRSPRSASPCPRSSPRCSRARRRRPRRRSERCDRVRGARERDRVPLPPRSRRRPAAPVRATGRPSDPSVSPLGRRIAFSSAGQVWVVYVDGTALRQVTSGPLLARGPSWSPAADALASRAVPRRAGRYRVGADGGDLRQLDVRERGRGRAGLVLARPDRLRAPPPRGDGDVFSISGRGGRATRLTRGKGDDGEPAWSPDGRFIAFTRAGRGVQDVYVMRPTGASHGALHGWITARALPRGRPTGTRSRSRSELRGRTGGCT